ncbi:MAG: alkaline shock response membrane anchor protein AmaP [Actinobacteria bacterium]|nr:alkaline shock response membrane anchor protein AmaP [Actinomycetota bacterium]
MNIFNRIVMVLLLICVAVFSIVSIVNIFANLFEWADVLDRILNRLAGVNAAVGILILLGILLISIALLFLQFYRKKIKIASILEDQSGRVSITLKTISQEIKGALKDAEYISDLKVKVNARQDGIIIDMFAKINKEANIPEKMQEIRTLAQDFASKKLGFRVIKTNLTAVGFTPKKENITQKVEEIKEAQEVSEAQKAPDALKKAEELEKTPEERQ